MFINAPTKLRSIIAVSNLSPASSFSTVFRFRISSSYRGQPPTGSTLSSLFNVEKKLPLSFLSSTRVFSCRKNSSDSDSVLEMASSPMDVSELSEDISRLSASLAELNHEAQGLAKVNVDKLESQHSPSPGKPEENLHEEEELARTDAGQGEVGNVGKTEDNCDVCTFNVGKNESPYVAGSLEGNVGKSENEIAGNDSQKAEIGKVGKTEDEREQEEEARALSEVLAAIQSMYAPGKLEGRVDEVQELAGKDVEVGKTEESIDMGKVIGGKNPAKVPVGKIEGDSDMCKYEGGNVGKLEKNVGKVVGKVGKSEEHNDGDDLSVAKSKHLAQSELEENIAKLEESFGPDYHVGIVGKTEGKEFVSPGNPTGRQKLGKLEKGVEESVGKTDNRNAPSELEDNVRKLEEAFGPDAHVGIVGKTEGKESVSTLDDCKESEQPGKLEVGKGLDVSKHTNSGKVEESAGKDEREVKTDQEVNVDNPGKTQSNLVSKNEMGTSGKSSEDGKVGGRKVAGKTESYSLEKHRSGYVECVIILASKDSEEAEHIDKLKTGEGLQLPDGAVVLAASEVTDSSVSEEFDVDLYLKNLPTARFGRFVLYSPLIPSTHTILSQNFHAFPPGSICVAGAQLQGKGRAGNVWQSPKGCLMFSFTIQMVSGRLVPFLQYIVSLAVIQAVGEMCKTMGLPSPDLRIKWPNDLYAKGVKIGGVLCTSSYRAKTFNIVVGVGLNVGNREPTTCLDALIQELDGEAHALKEEELLAAIMFKFETLNHVFQDFGFSPLQDAYYEKWLHSGQSVILEEKEPGTSRVSHVPVTIHGLTPVGYLLATDDVGEQYELHPDGNSFDFLKGLVRQKLPA